MNELLSELGRKLADRWLAVVVLPGLLFVAVAYCAVVLGQARALEVGLLVAQAGRVAAELSPSPAIVIIGLALTLLAATAAGLLAQALAAVVRAVLVTSRPRWLVAWRHRRAHAAAVAAGSTIPMAYLTDRLWSVGDRFRLADKRIDAQYGLSLVLAWPRVWLLLAEPSRAPIAAASTNYRDATVLAGWSLLYLGLGVRWWPGAVIGITALLIGIRRAGRAAGVLADVVEAAVDVHQQDLAEALGVALPLGRLTPQQGAEINNILGKRA